MTVARRWCAAFSFLVGLGLGSASQAQPVDYLRICDAFGVGFFYIPLSDSCLQATTGDQRTQTDQGLIRHFSRFESRLRALESDLCDDCFGVVRRDGKPKLSASEKIQSSSRAEAGEYEVLFAKRVNECAINANLESGGRHPPGMITVALTPDADNRGVSVRTFNASGRPADRAFQLSLECPPREFFCQQSNNTGTFPCNEDDVGHLP